MSHRSEPATATANPTTHVDRCVCWCTTCGLTVPDQPDWAATHHQQTQHPTARRSWRVDTWDTP